MIVSKQDSFLLPQPGLYSLNTKDGFYVNHILMEAVVKNKQTVPLTDFTKERGQLHPERIFVKQWFFMDTFLKIIDKLELLAKPNQ